MILNKLYIDLSLILSQPKTIFFAMTLKINILS